MNEEDDVPLAIIAFVIVIAIAMMRCADAAEDWRAEVTLTRQIAVMAPEDVHALAAHQANPKPEPVPCYQVRTWHSPTTGPALTCITEAQWRRQQQRQEQP
ncbi:MAG: hypothetical protein AB7P97_21955 [Hyphomonadaceae bacterium]